MVYSLEAILVFLLFFLLPVGWSKHWLVSDSLVNGVLVDYLMPDVWFQDILALILIVVLWKRRGRGFFKRVSFGLLLLLFPLFFSSVPLISFISTTRFLLAVTLGYLLIKRIRAKDGKEIKQMAIKGLGYSLVWTTLLALAQFVKQQTVFGWWFLGEPIFGSGTGGVKKIGLRDSILVTPMATFPHSNVLGAFALLSLLVFLNQKSSRLRSASILLSVVLVILSSSLPVWILTLFVLLFFIRNKKISWKQILIVTLFTFFAIQTGVIEKTSISRRLELIKISANMIKDYPFFGVGWGCFVKKLPQYWIRLGLNLRFLQPVHNLFFIAVSEIGFLGLSGIIILIGSLYYRVLKKRYILYFAVLLVLSSIDHYFWTVTQGIYLPFLIFCLL